MGESEKMDVASLAAHALDGLKNPIPLKDALKRIPDFRLDRRKRHQLHEILLIAVCSMITGGKGPTDFERFGKRRASREVSQYSATSVQRPVLH